jgi:hypothetical protein
MRNIAILQSRHGREEMLSEDIITLSCVTELSQSELNTS